MFSPVRGRRAWWLVRSFTSYGVLERPVPEKMMRMHRARGPRPTMLAIAGDSAAGKTTLARGIVAALGAERSTSLCVDDYHRYDRAERSGLPFTALHPDCNYMQIMEQHLQLLATGEPVLKPVYDHSTGLLPPPPLLEPREVVIAEGLLPLHTRLSRACFDVTVYVDPGERIRRGGKVRPPPPHPRAPPDPGLAQPAHPPPR